MAIAFATLSLRSSQPKTARPRLQNTWKRRSQHYPIHQRKRLSASAESKGLPDRHWVNSAPSCLCCFPNNPPADRLESISSSAFATMMLRSPVELLIATNNKGKLREVH